MTDEVQDRLMIIIEALECQPKALIQLCKEQSQAGPGLAPQSTRSSGEFLNISTVRTTMCSAHGRPTTSRAPPLLPLRTALLQKRKSGSRAQSHHLSDDTLRLWFHIPPLHTHTSTQTHTQAHTSTRRGGSSELAETSGRLLSTINLSRAERRSGRASQPCAQMWTG